MSQASLSQKPALLAVVLLAAATALLPDQADAASDERQTAHLRSRLVAAETAVRPGTTLMLGLLFEHDEHWHTYWRNPGDSGLKTEVEMSLPDGLQFHGIDWPAPERFVLSEDITNFGYSGRRLLPLRVTVPANFSGDNLPITVKARWLICEHECIPGKAEYTMNLPVQRDAAAVTDARWAADFADSAVRQPQPAAIEAVLQTTSDALQLTLSGSAVPTNLADWTLFPVAEEVIDYGSAPVWQARAGQWQTQLTRSDYFSQLPTGSEWLLVKGKQALVFTARASQPAN